MTEPLTIPLSSILGGSNGASRIEFSQAGGPPRSLLGKLRDSVSVKDFGAAGDGVSDDSSAVSAAISAASFVFFPPGVYVLEDVEVQAGRVIFSDGGATLRLKQQPSLSFKPVFRVVGGDVTFRNLSFDGNRANQPANGFSDSWNTGGNGTGKSNRAGIYMDNAEGTVGNGLAVDSCKFTGFYAASVASRNVSNVCITGCSFADTNLEPCFITRSGGSDNSGVQVLGCRFSGIGAGSALVQGNCIVVSGYTGVVISNNRAGGFERTFAKLESCSGVSICGNYIENNTFGNFPAIQFSGSGAGLLVHGNVIEEVRSGVLVTADEIDGIADVVIASNLIGPTTPGIGVSDCIQLERVKNASVSGNTLRDTGRMAVYCTASKNISITGNAITASSNSGASAISVVVPLDAGDVSITGNRVSGTQSGADGVVTLSGAGAIRSLVFSANTINGASAENGRGLFTAGNQVQMIGAAITGNIFGADASIEIYPAPGSTVLVESNVSLAEVAP